MIGEPGVGKTAIAEALALRIVRGDVPENLKNDITLHAMRDKKPLKVFICLSLICLLTSCGANTSITSEINSNIEQHVHEMSYVSYVAPTCVNEGIIEHYHCSTCNKNYEDENGLKELNVSKISKERIVSQ